MYIKLDGLEITNLGEGYDAMPKNVYGQAKRTPSLKMVKVLLGTVYEIDFTILKLNKNDSSDLLKILLKPNIQVEFFDLYSKQYKVLDCYCEDPKISIKRAFENGDVLLKPLTLKLIANEKADWVVL